MQKGQKNRMPELPEVENVAIALRQTLLGRRLDGMSVRWAKTFEPSPAAVRRAVLGKRLTAVRRHGKYLLLRFSPDGLAVRETSPAYGAAAAPAEAAPWHAGEAQLMLHLRMTGQLFADPAYRPDHHLRAAFDFEGLSVHFRDQRKFGRFTLVDGAEHPRALAHVGPDMLEIAPRDWFARIRDRRAPIKALLLEQGIAAGLGNIYADEALFRARVHPAASPAALGENDLRRIFKEARAVLRLAVRHGGTTFLDFLDFRGRPGNFRRKLRVYGRTGQACPRCATPIARLRIGGRSSHFCPRCQPAASS
jgi:formamidopyrimidine-DNA glycosylase